MKLFLKKGPRIVLLSLVVLLTLLALAWTAISFWSRTKWDRVKRELQGRGEPLSLIEVQQPGIPDESNFYATSFWHRLQEWAGQVDRLPTEAERQAMLNQSPLAVFSIENGETGKRRGLGTMAKVADPLYRRQQRTDLDGFARAYRDSGLVENGEGTPARQILTALERVAPVLQELEDAASRPGSKLDYKLDEGNLYESHFYHAPAPMTMCQTLRVRALARMLEGDSEGASRDIVLMLRLAKAAESEPFLMFQLVGMSCESMAVSTFWETNALGQWNESQLKTLRGAFATSYPLENLANGLRGERAMANTWMSRFLADGAASQASRLNKGNGEPSIEEMYRGYPRPLLLNDLAAINLFQQEGIDILKTRDAAAAIRMQEGTPKALSRFLQPLAETIRAPISAALIRAFQTQQHLGMVDVACALEEYRLRKGTFPENLSDLVPDDLPSADVQPIPGYPITYQLTAPDEYRLTCPAVPSSLKLYTPKDGQWTWNRR